MEQLIGGYIETREKNDSQVWFWLLSQNFNIVYTIWFFNKCDFSGNEIRMKPFCPSSRAETKKYSSQEVVIKKHHKHTLIHKQLKIGQNNNNNQTGGGDIIFIREVHYLLLYIQCEFSTNGIRMNLFCPSSSTTQTNKYSS